MKSKRLRLPPKRVSLGKRPAKSGPGHTSTGKEVRPVLAVGPIGEEAELCSQFAQRLFRAAKKPRS